ncbi:MAG: sulfotransferase family protein [Acidimicrobiales bacterium]
MVPLSMRRSLVSRRITVRLAIDAARMKPDFLVVGAQRTGTSSLYKYLGQHPHIAPSLRKEVSYFTRYYGRGPDWYSAHFPLAMRQKLVRRWCGHGLSTFGATPDYLLRPLAAERARRHVPDARIIVLLRDPVARAYSHYQHMVRLGFESLSFEEAVSCEPERLAEDLERIVTDPGHDPKFLVRFSYVTRGLYAEQLRTWMRHFPPERFLILDSEGFYARPDDAYQKVLRFLDLPAWRPPHYVNFSIRGRARGPSEPMTPATRTLLAQRFAEPNHALGELLGRDFAWA